MNKIKFENIENLNNSFYHFAPKSALKSINEKGLVASIGEASKLKNEDENRVYLSQGVKGVLAIKNSFVWEFMQLRICDIPPDYRQYFNYDEYNSDEKIPKEDVYTAMANRMKDEVYFLVDAREGEDFLDEDMNSSFGGVHDIKGKPNHNISPDKLSVIVSPEGYTAYDMLKNVYYRLLEKNPQSTEIIKDMNSSLNEMFEYIEHGIIKENDVVDIGMQVAHTYKEPSSIEIEDENNQSVNRIIQMLKEKENGITK